MNTRALRIGARSAATTAPVTSRDVEADIRTLVGLAASGGCRIEHMRLVRWRNLRKILAQRWDELGASVADTLRSEIVARLGPKGRCVGYDESSILVLCPPPGDPALRRFDGEFTDAVGAILAGALCTPGAIEVLKPVSASDQGLTFETATDANPQPSATGRTVGTLVLGDAVFRYFPLWDVHDDTVFCYLCEASWNLGDGDNLPENALKAQFDDPKRTLALDLETLNKASGDLDKGLNRYQLAKFLIPVHFRTVADSSTAAAYIRYCNGRMWAVHEFALFEIVNPPDGVTAVELADAIGKLEPFGAGVMCRVGTGFSRFDAVPTNSILSVGIDLRLGGQPESKIIADIEKFGEAAKVHGLRSHVHGLHTVSPSVIAACAGIDLIGTDAVTAGVDEWQPDGAVANPVALLKSLAARGKVGRGTG